MVESAPPAPFKYNDSGFCVVELRDAKDLPMRGVGIAKCTIATLEWNPVAEEHRYSMHLHVSGPSGEAAKVHVEEVPGGLLSPTIPEEAVAKSRLLLAQMSSASAPWVSPLFQIEKSFMNNSAEEFEVATAARRHMVGPPVLPVKLAVDKVFADLGVLDLIAPWLAQKDRARLQAVSRSLRRAGIESKVVNRVIFADISSMDHIESLKLWVIPRGAAVLKFTLHWKKEGGDQEQFTDALSEMVEHFRVLKQFEITLISECAWTPPAALWNLPLEDLTLRPHVALIAPENMQQLTKLDITVQDSLPEGLLQLRQLKELCLNVVDDELDFPPEISQLSALESLKIESESGELETLSPRIGLLKQLQSFKLTYGDIESLPVEIYTLTALRILKLDNCGTVGPLLSSIGDLDALEELELSYCKGITSLPPEISRLQKLHTLFIQYGAFESLPPEIGMLSSLRSLTLTDCDKLISLPPEIGQCAALEQLDIENGDDVGSMLTTLPPELGQLKSLTSISLSGCYTLMALPSGIGELSALRSLDLFNCENLKLLPEEVGHLNSLTYLNLSNCVSLESLPQSISRLLNLQSLNITGPTNLHSLNVGILHLTKLKPLNISACKWLVFGSGDGTSGGFRLI